MTHKIEINIPTEFINEIETYAKAENITVNEFILWALGEKVGELRERRKLKNLTRINLPSPSDKTTLEKNQQQEPVNTKRLLKAEEVAKLLGMSKAGVYNLMRSGEIPVVKIGAAVRIQEEDLNTFILKSKT